VISGARTNLRVPNKDDFEWLVVELNKPLSRGQWSGFFLRNPAEIERDLFDPSPAAAGDLIIEDKQGRRLGLASWSQVDPISRNAAMEISIFDPGDRGKGFGLEAHRLLVDHLFRHRGLHRIEILSALENEPEQKLLERLRFQREGVLRKARFAQGAWHDLAVYALLEEEWLDVSWDQLSF
jgi:aminoglycoside 6'-N-acetyltransferase